MKKKIYGRLKCKQVYPTGQKVENVNDLRTVGNQLYKKIFLILYKCFQKY